MAPTPVHSRSRYGGLHAPSRRSLAIRRKRNGRPLGALVDDSGDSAIHCPAASGRRGHGTPKPPRASFGSIQGLVAKREAAQAATRAKGETPAERAPRSVTLCSPEPVAAPSERASARQGDAFLGVALLATCGEQAICCARTRARRCARRPSSPRHPPCTEPGSARSGRGLPSPCR